MSNCNLNLTNSNVDSVYFVVQSTGQTTLAKMVQRVHRQSQEENHPRAHCHNTFAQAKNEQLPRMERLQNCLQKVKKKFYSFFRIFLDSKKLVEFKVCEFVLLLFDRTRRQWTVNARNHTQICWASRQILRKCKCQLTKLNPNFQSENIFPYL